MADRLRGINHSVQSTVDAIREHPLLPKDLEVLGFIMDPHTGAVRGSFREKGIKYENQKVAFCLSKGRLFSFTENL